MSDDRKIGESEDEVQVSGKSDPSIINSLLKNSHKSASYALSDSQITGNFEQGDSTGAAEGAVSQCKISFLKRWYTVKQKL